MKKFLILLIAICLAFPVSATAYQVIDNANLLSVQEEQMLSQQLITIENAHNIDVVVLTEYTIGGADSQDYADDYYDNNGYSSNGALLLLVMDTRQWYLSTKGSCISLLDYNDIGKIVAPYFSKGEYYKGFTVFAKLVKASAENPEGDGEYIVDEYGDVSFQPHVRHWYDGLGICLIIGLVVGGISVAVMASGMKSVYSKNGASNYVDERGLMLTRQEDRYLYQTITKRGKPKNNSSTHRSSSGSRHGGGGGRF